MFKYDLLSKGISLKVNAFSFAFYFRHYYYVNNFKLWMKSICSNLKVTENWYF